MIVSGIRSRQPAREAWTRSHLKRERAIALGQSIDASTWSNYSSALNSYLEFVKNHDFPVDPTPDTLSFFTVYMSFHIKPDSVDTYLSGICQQLEPYFPDVRQNQKSPLVKHTLDGCKRIQAIPTSRKRALTFDDLQTILHHYAGSSSHDDLLFVAQLLVGFFALMRLGELSDPDNKNLRNPLHQENMRVVFGHLWGLWKDLKTSKTRRPHIFWETGTFSFRDMVIFERPSRIFQR